MELDQICTSCLEGQPKNECPNSERPCGHHCNHSWEQDQCCWCGKEFGEVDRSEDDPDPAEWHYYVDEHGPQ